MRIKLYAYKKKKSYSWYVWRIGLYYDSSAS